MAREAASGKAAAASRLTAKAICTLDRGNGTFDTTLNSQDFPSDGDYGDSVIKLSVDPSTAQQPEYEWLGFKGQ